jgi:hypothetical protein
LGFLTAVLNNLEYETGLGLEETRTEILPPDGVSESEWNEAVAQAMVDVGVEYGFTENGGTPGEIDSDRGVFSARAPTEFSILRRNNCYTLAGEIVSRAEEIVGQSAGGGADFIGPPAPEGL